MHAEHFDKMFSYVDGTQGDDGKSEKANQEGTSTRISEWKPNTYMDKAKHHPFAEFKIAKPGAYPGSIDYSEVEALPGHMARTIAWEAWHRDKAERALKKMREKHEHTGSATVNISKKNAARGFDQATLLAKIVELMTNHGGNNKTPHEKTGAHKKKKNHGSEEKQLKRYNNNIQRLKKIYEDQGKVFVPKPFKAK